jgi:hypothetical protein
VRRLLAIVTVLAAAAPAAEAQQRAFTVEGTESRVGERPYRGVADLDVRPDGLTVLLLDDTSLVVRDARGSNRQVTYRITTPRDAATDVDVGPGTTLFAVVAGRAWGVSDNTPYDLVVDRPATPLTPPVGYDSPEAVNGLASLPDGSVLIARARRVTRLAPGGTETRIAGSGARGTPRPGRALDSPLSYVEEVTPTPAGGVLFADAGRIWHVRADGTLERFAGRGRGDPTAPVPPQGRRADLIAFGYDGGPTGIRTISGDPADEVVVGAPDGVYSIRGGIVREIVDAGFDPPVEPQRPLWSGGLARTARLNVSGGAARTRDGAWIFGTTDGLAILTDAQGRSAHFGMAVTTATLASAARGTIQIAATQPAHVRVQVEWRNRTFASVSGRLEPGLNTLRLPRRLPPGVVFLHASALAEDGGIARHRLPVLGRRELPPYVARHAIALDARAHGLYGNGGRCRRARATSVVCVAEFVDEDNEGAGRTRYTITLRTDGWLWLSSPGVTPRRIELRRPDWFLRPF